MTTRGRPRKPITGDTDIHVAVMLPPWVVEAIDSETDSENEPRGAYVARLFMERLAVATTDRKLKIKLSDLLFGC